MVTYVCIQKTIWLILLTFIFLINSQVELKAIGIDFLQTEVHQFLSDSDTLPEQTEIISPIGKPQTVDNRIYQLVDEMARFPGCEGMFNEISMLYECADNRMVEFFIQHIRYPEEASRKGVEGSVITAFVVTKTGELQNISIMEGIGYGCDEEVIRILNLMNEMEERWIPARIDGQKVNSIFYFPVRFSIERQNRRRFLWRN